MGYVNSVGQTIEVGDTVVYIATGNGFSPQRGIFLGLTPRKCVRIAHDTQKSRAVMRGGDSKVFSYNDAHVWARKPYDFYIHKESGLLMDSETHSERFRTLTWYELQQRGIRQQPPEIMERQRERGNYRSDPEGKLRKGFTLIEKPRVYIGVKGLERTFKVEIDA